MENIAVQRLICGILACFVACALAAAEDDLEAAARRIDQRLMAPCCMTNTVDVHESGVAQAMRREIRDLLAAGRNEAEILDHFVERYGPQILAMPAARGFSLLPYLAPGILMLAAAVALALAMRRWRRADRRAAQPASPRPAVPAGPYAERLKHALDEFD